MSKFVFYLLIIISIASLSSCGVGESYLPIEDQSPPPLAEEVIIDLFTDIHLAEAITSLNRQALRKSKPDSIFLSKRSEGYSYIYEKYDLNKEMIDSVLLFYSKRPKAFDALYQKIQENIDSLEQVPLKPEILDSSDIAKPDSSDIAKPDSSTIIKEQSKTKN